MSAADPNASNYAQVFASVFDHRLANDGKHIHHRVCIHNLPPEEQVAAHGKTVEWWLKAIGPLPQQITPEQWETEPPEINL
jgi:hypothetical protein